MKVKATDVDKNEQRDRGSRTGTLLSPQVIMANGGCKSPMRHHSNGEEWHPVVASAGEQKCINCKCKVSRMTFIKLWESRGDFLLQNDKIMKNIFNMAHTF